MKQEIKIENLDTDSFNSKFPTDKKQSWFASLWKDPVISKIIAGIILTGYPFLHSVISSLIKSHSISEFIHNLLFADIKFYWILLIVVIYIIIVFTINFLIKKRKLLPIDFIINLKFGRFKFIELITALESHLFPAPKSLQKNDNDTISAVVCFVLFNRRLSEGFFLQIEDGDQDLFLYNSVCPILHSYGLLKRKKENNPKPGNKQKINFYYLSKNGNEFYQALQIYRSYFNQTMEEW